MIHQGTNVLDQHAKRELTYDGKLEQITFLDRRSYKRSEGVYYPSVTTILQYLPKGKFFEQWLKEVGPNADIILQKAGKEGTQLHEAAEDLINGNEITWLDNYGNAKYSLIVWEMICRFVEFWKEYKPEVILLEEFTYSDTYKYAGTADLVVRLNDEIWLLDLKSSNSLYKSYDLQLAAYAKALEETKGIKVDRTGILWMKALTRGPSTKKGVIQGDGWQLKPVDEIEKNFDLFQAVYKIYRIDNPTSEPAFNTFPISLKL